MAVIRNSAQDSVVAHGQRFDLESLSVSERETFHSLSDEVWQMFENEMAAEYYETRANILEQWLTKPSMRHFIEKAVSAYIEQERILTDDVRTWDKWFKMDLQEAGLTYNEWRDWKKKIRRFLREREDALVYNISLERFSECFVKANYRTENFEAKVVVAYLEHRMFRDFPLIYLGTMHGWPLALNLIGNTIHDLRDCNMPGDESVHDNRDEIEKSLGPLKLQYWPDDILSVRYKPLCLDGSWESFIFKHIGHVYRAEEKSLDIGAMKENLFVELLDDGLNHYWSYYKEDSWLKFRSPWKLTDATIAMRISNNGTPEGLYLLKSGESWKIAWDEGMYYPKIEDASDAALGESWTVAEITNLDYRELKGYDSSTGNKSLSLKPLSLSQVEISSVVCIRPRWNVDNPPFGLFPVKGLDST